MRLQQKFALQCCSNYEADFLIMPPVSKVLVLTKLDCFWRKVDWKLRSRCIPMSPSSQWPHNNLKQCLNSFQPCTWWGLFVQKIRQSLIQYQNSNRTRYSGLSTTSNVLICACSRAGLHLLANVDIATEAQVRALILGGIFSVVFLEEYLI